MFMAIATHHPDPEHVAELEGHMNHVRDAVRADAAGLLDFNCYRSDDGARLFGVSRWDSREAFEAAQALLVSSCEGRRDEWTIADDEMLTLESF